MNKSITSYEQVMKKSLRLVFNLELKLSLVTTSPVGGWVTKTKLMLIWNQVEAVVEAVVEAEVELGNKPPTQLTLKLTKILKPFHFTTCLGGWGWVGVLFQPSLAGVGAGAELGKICTQCQLFPYLLKVFYVRTVQFQE